MSSQYGGANRYGGSTIYGADSPATAPAIVVGVGVKFDVALNNVGLRLVSGEKGYVKSAAPTFAFNLKNQFASATRLSARDLFYWNRWEHNDWTLGEQTSIYTPGVNDSAYSQSTGFDVTQPGKLSHLPAVSPVTSASDAFRAGASYNNFVEDVNGNLWWGAGWNGVNANTMEYTSDGGVSTTVVGVSATDTGAITAIWSSGAKVFVATTNNLYAGTTAGFAPFISKVDATPGTVLAGVNSGTYYNGAHYVGAGTKLYYIDNAGQATTEFDTATHNITVVTGYQGKIYFGGNRGNNSRLWTWTWTGAPPTPANGAGAEIQQGTLPNGFIITSVTVYLNLLELGGYFPGVGGSAEGVGAVYYINGSLFGQLVQVGKKQAGRSWQINSLFGYNNLLLMGYNHKVGIGVYDFAHGAFSAWVGTQTYTDGPNNQVLAVAAHKSRYYFMVKADGKIWRSGDTPVASATIDSLEFNQLAFVPKLIDGHEHAHSPLNAGEKVEIYLSFDEGNTFALSGADTQLNSAGGNMALRNAHGAHWRSRLISYVGSDTTKSPRIYDWAERMNPQPTKNHLWKLQIILQKTGAFKDSSPMQDPDDKIIKALWNAQSLQGTVDFIDLDGNRYSVIVIDANEIRLSNAARKRERIRKNDQIWEVELMEAGG